MTDNGWSTPVHFQMLSCTFQAIRSFNRPYLSCFLYVKTIWHILIEMECTLTNDISSMNLSTEKKKKKKKKHADESPILWSHSN